MCVQIFEQAFKFAAELRTRNERLSNVVLMVRYSYYNFSCPGYVL
jgi:hypothetical protein